MEDEDPGVEGEGIQIGHEKEVYFILFTPDLFFFHKNHLLSKILGD